MFKNILVGLLSCLLLGACDGQLRYKKTLAKNESATGFSSGELQSKAMTILQKNCATCHSANGSGNVSNITNPQWLLSSGLVVAGNAFESRLYKPLVNNQMPPGNPLFESDKMAISDWINSLAGVGPNGSKIDLSFNFAPNKSPLPFQVRLTKVTRSAGSAANLSGLINNRFALGDYNFGVGQTPNYNWQATEMVEWLTGLQPVCAAADLKVRYPYPAGLNAFFQLNYGRDMNSEDKAAVAAVDSLNATASEKFEIVCMAMLTSREFITK